MTMAGPYSGRLADFLQEGLASARPASINNYPGTLCLYYATDTSVLSGWDGSAWHTISTGGGTGTVTSVGLSAPAEFNVSGSPVTGSGTITLAKAVQSANQVYAGPTSGSSSAPGFRTLVGADIPIFGASGASHAPGGVPDPGATSGSTRYLREDGSWAAPSGGGGGVSSLNSLSGALSIAAGANVTVTPSGSTITIAAAAAGLSVFNVKSSPYNAAGNGTTDDTTAIQGAINAAYAAGGGVVYFPTGVYLVAGAMQDTSRSNCQLLLPQVNTTSAVQTTIMFMGDLPPGNEYGLSISTPLPAYGAIIKSNVASGTGNVIGGWGPSGSPSDFTYVNAVFKNIAVRTVPNPTISAVDLSHCSGCDIDNLSVDSGALYVAGVTQPTTTSSFGVRTPWNNNGASSRIGVCTVIGFYNGIEISEHVTAQMLNVGGCVNAYPFTFAYHSSSIQRMLAQWCTNVIVGPTTGGAHYTQIDELDIEHATSGWYATAYDVVDTANLLGGSLRWHVVLAGTGISNTFTMNGGLNLLTTQVGFTQPARLNYNSQSGTSYTVALSDIGNMVTMSNASACALTLPSDSTVPIPVGSLGYFAQGGAGAVTATAGSGVTLRTPNGAATAAQYDARGWEKMASNTFRIW